jgi:hypothetical protein
MNIYSNKNAKKSQGHEPQKFTPEFLPSSWSRLSAAPPLLPGSDLLPVTVDGPAIPRASELAPTVCALWLQLCHSAWLH